jgi:D-alanine-D-alanine ligase
MNSPAELKRACRMLLERYRQPVLVEEFLPGREFTVALLGNGPEARVLGGMEIVIRQSQNGGIYSYQNKELCDELVSYSPLSKDELGRQVAALALASYLALECRDTARVDIRCDGQGQPCFMEVNPLPGLHPTHSDLPMIATQEGMSFAELIGTIIEAALSRAGRRRGAETPVAVAD